MGTFSQLFLLGSLYWSDMLQLLDIQARVLRKISHFVVRINETLYQPH